MGGGRRAAGEVVKSVVCPRLGRRRRRQGEEALKGTRKVTDRKNKLNTERVVLSTHSFPPTTKNNESIKNNTRKNQDQTGMSPSKT